MIFVVEGEDFSSFVKDNGCSFRPRKVSGSNEGYMKDGTHVPDIVATKMDYSIIIEASNQTLLYPLLSLLCRETVSIKLNNPISNTVSTSKYESSIDSLNFAMEDSSNEKFWYGFTVNLSEV